MQLRALLSLLGSALRHRSRSFALVLTASVALTGAAPMTRDEHHGTDVVVVATGLRSGQGVVRACMTSERRNFPACRGASASYNAIGDAGTRVTLTFRDVKPGRYAIALLHDENRNGKADRAAMMIPREGFGFSRDAMVRFGPPKFGEAAFDVGASMHDPLVIRMRYML